MFMLSTGLQVVTLVLISLLVGAMFGIWRGYDPAGFSPGAFVEVHQGAVRGLNLLLPMMGLSTIVLVIVLAVLARSRPRALWLYAGAVLLLVIAAAITRFANQPINDQVMGWSPSTVPDNWAALRDGWWSWHMARLASAFAAELLLIAAIFIDRDSGA